jgi:pseudouridine-5'-phosphate glycosidase
VRVSAEVEAAVRDRRPVVALESTLFVHGLPRPDGLQLALALEDQLRGAGVVPATVGVVAGDPVVGLDREQIELLADAPDVAKANAGDLPLAIAAGRHAATTVAATTWLAHRAGVRVFATGGIGGVHRDGRETFDESADLVALSRTPVTVICSGVKSVLDVPATVERLETLGVGVLGYRTRRFPGFLVGDAAIDLTWSVDGPAAVVAAMRARDELGLAAALLVANPVPAAEELDPALHDRLLREALQAAADNDVRGRAVTPFLLAHVQRGSGGRSLATNLALVRHNVAVAADIAVAWST